MIGNVKAIAASAKTGSTCTAIVNGVETVVNVARDLTVAAGDALLVGKVGAEWYAFIRLGTAAPAVVDTPVQAPPPKQIKTGRKVIYPIETRSYGSVYGWRSDDDPRQGEYSSNGNNIGCAFYGNRFSGLSGSTCNRITVNIKRKNEGGSASSQPLTMRLVNQKTRPGGSPTLGASTSGPSLRWGAKVSAFVLPDSWGQALINGTSGGLAVYESDGSPYMIIAGRSSYSTSFVITIDWTRS